MQHLKTAGIMLAVLVAWWIACDFADEGVIPNVLDYMPVAGILLAITVLVA